MYIIFQALLENRWQCLNMLESVSSVHLIICSWLNSGWHFFLLWTVIPTWIACNLQLLTMVDYGFLYSSPSSTILTLLTVSFLCRCWLWSTYYIVLEYAVDKNIACNRHGCWLWLTDQVWIDSHSSFFSLACLHKILTTVGFLLHCKRVRQKKHPWRQFNYRYWTFSTDFRQCYCIFYIRKVFLGGTSKSSTAFFQNMDTLYLDANISWFTCTLSWQQWSCLSVPHSWRARAAENPAGTFKFFPPGALNFERFFFTYATLTTIASLLDSTQTTATRGFNQETRHCTEQYRT